MSPKIDAYGTVDELNSFIALLVEEVTQREDREFLVRIQSKLFSLGSYLASEVGFMECRISEEEIEEVEKEIDKMDSLVPPIKKFILPGGCKANAVAHICRTVCRRAERCIYRLREAEDIDNKALKYVNRLSDYFFVLARKQNFVNNIDEIIWDNSCK